MTFDDASFLERPDLPASFERWEVVLPAGASRATEAAEWAGALIRIDHGTLDVECRAGGHQTFHTGDLLALGWLPLTELHNRGAEPVRIVAVRRRGPHPTDRFLRITRSGHHGEGESRT